MINNIATKRLLIINYFLYEYKNKRFARSC